MLHENTSLMPKRYQVLQVALSIPFFVLYGFTLYSEWLLVGLTLVIPILMDNLFYGMYLIINNTSLVHSDFIYSASLLWHKLSHLFCSIILWSMTKQMSYWLLLHRILAVWMAYCIVSTLQKAILFAITYKTIWRSSLEKIREAVIKFQIYQGFQHYVQRKVPNFVLNQRLRSQRKQSSVYTDAVSGSFKNSIIETHDVEAPDTTVSSTLQQVLAFTAPNVPLSIVHAAINDIEMDPQEGALLYRSVMKALNSKEPGRLLGTNYTDLNYSALQEIFRETDLCNIARLVLGSTDVISQSQFIHSYEEAVVQRNDLQENLDNYDQMMRTLNRALSAVSMLVMFFSTMLIFGFPILQNYPLIISSFIAMGIVFGSTATRFFEGLVYVFFIRPCHIGDTVFLKDEKMNEFAFTVRKLSLLTTEFEREDGQCVIMSNFRLKDSVIVNAYRSGPSTSYMQMQIPDLSVSEVLDLERTLGCAVVVNTIEDTALVITIKVQHKTNMQNMTKINTELALVRQKVGSFLGQRAAMQQQQGC